MIDAAIKLTTYWSANAGSHPEEWGTHHTLLMMEFQLKLRTGAKPSAVQRMEVTKVSVFKQDLKERMSGKQQLVGKRGNTKQRASQDETLLL